MAAAFQPLGELNPLRMGLMWRDLFEDEFPTVEEQPAVTVQFERFGPPALSEPTLRIERMEKPPWPRLWLLSEDGAQLIQLQRDWLARNWRRVNGSGTYPRFPTLRDRFEADIGRIGRYVAERGWGEIVFTQCELTYFNHIDLQALGLGPGDIAEVLSLAAVPDNDEFLPSAELIQMNAQYLVSDGDRTIARLYVTANPALRREDRAPILVLTLSAKGPPMGADIDGVLQFFDIARAWIVRGFVNITRPNMHEHWGRRGEQ